MLAQRHSMLRARFSKSEGGRWHQYVTDATDASFVVQNLQPRDTEELVQALQQSRSRLDIESGLVMTAVLCHGNEHQSLFMAIHHLVVDLVSWRVLLEELEDFLLGRALSPAPLMTFQTWRAIQADYIARDTDASSATHETMELSQLAYWGATPSAMSNAPTAMEQFVLSSEATFALLGSCNDTLQTRPHEIMVAALLYSFAAVFPDRNPPPVFNETHGREPWDNSIDLSRTVGWFTSMFPIQAPASTHRSLLDVIRATKDCMRSFKHNGRPYFASRFVNQDSAQAFASLFPVEIVFNYQGVYQQLERGDSLFKTLAMPGDGELTAAAEGARFSLFTVSAVVQNACAHLAVDYSGVTRHEARIREWFQQYKTALEEAPILLRNSTPAWTLSDLPLAFHSYIDLDLFRNQTLAELSVRPEEVEDVYPCSPMQEGILASQNKDPDAYRTCSIIQVVSKHDTRIDCARLQQAWKAVVRRHSLLRALLVDNVPGSSGITNVVLKDPLPSMSVFQAAVGDAVTPQLFRSRYNPADRQTGGLQHHLSICQLDEESVYLCLDINHAIIDAHSTTIIIRDLQTAYTSSLDAHGAQFSSVIAYRQQQSQEEASRYWADHLAGIEPCHFPSMAVAGHQQHRDETIQVPGLSATAIHAFCKTWEITPATVIQTAWALVLSRYAGSTDPCFGTLSSGRDAPIDDIEDIFGPLVTMLTCRVRLNEQLTVLEALRSVQSDFTNALTHQTFSLASVHNMLRLGTSVLFNTALTIQRVNVANPGIVPEISFSVQDGLDPTEYDISIGASYSDTVVEVSLAFRTTCMDQGQATRLAGTLGAAIAAITAEPDSRVQDLNIATEEEAGQLWAWNRDVPPSMDACIHDLFAEKASDQPSAPAICSWDGEMTYHELDGYSTKLAGHLVQLGVEPEDIVPLCFEKSMWTIVAMLAVLKAGGAFAPLDPGHPRSRHEEIVKLTQSKVVLASVQFSTLWKGSAVTVVAVSQTFIRHLAYPVTRPLGSVCAGHLAYVTFTSGSTGVPKGVLVEHRAITTSCFGHGQIYALTPSTRFLQFAAYTFDISMTEIMTTLLHGGCVCIPSESGKRDSLAETIEGMQVNCAKLTPTVARLIHHHNLPSLRKLILGAEPVSLEDSQRWPEEVQVINTYGPTECSVTCTGYIGLQGFKSGMIGKSIASVSWVVDPNNHNKLAPLGSIGELLVEGPILARGYLDDAEKTAAAFIEDPAWLLQGGGGHPGRHGRLYKTGDLVSYDPDGNLIYVGRKDSQVKIRGQRVELGEIEHHMRECVPESQQTAVEVIFLGGEKSSATLAAFLQLEDKKIDALRAGKPADNGLPVQMLFLAEVDKQMVDRVPNYMLPSVYFALPQLPMTTSGKTDRKRLREIGASFSAQQLAAMRTSSEGPKRAPSTQAERTMQQLWARVLNIEPGSIGLDDCFLRLGGDSIAAMKLVGEARKQGLQLDSAHVFRQPKLAQMCITPRRPIVNSTEPLPPFSLLPPTIKDSIFCRGDLLGAVQRKDVANILPTTHTQRMFINRGIKSPHEAFNYLLFDIGPDLDLQLLRDSCQRLLDYFPILRTQFTPFQGDVWQVVLLRPHLPFITFNVSGPLSEETHAICLQDIQNTDPLGLPTAFMLVCNKSIRHQLILRLSHAQYDGVCIPIIFDTLSALYKQETLPPAPPDFSAFLAHTRHQRTESARYWCELLKGSHITKVTAHLRPKTSEAPALESVMVERMICAPQLPKNITMASLLSSAWALVLSSITGEDDVVYGHLVAGRNADIPGVAEIVGPCLNIVPVRVRTHLAKAPAELVRSVHEQYISLGQSDSAQLNEIIQDCTDWPAGSEFDSIVQHQNINEHPAIDFAGNMAKFQWFKNPFRVAEQLWLLTEPQGDQLKLTLDGNTRILTVETTHSVLDMFAATIAKLSTSLQEPFTPQNFSSHSASGTERAQG
ncbi:acetyl-CoA synthetase-like protein [Clathrospora elynae]|uniref:Acetyl-CoA synthetase-like protein n=1 Tax=Clathrospora elynae TaxID=706981 RepID=A0A6A5SCY6_9PLEO|nr:acetyl-CoA synthetase-like protein [Clathrospora elynae]